MRWLMVVAAALAIGGVGSAIVLAGQRAAAPVEISIRYSSFVPGTIEVRAGQAVAFVLSNHDPIDHEWIVGDEDVHDRHRTGTEPHHASRPTEVSVPAGEVRGTTVVFAEPGTVRFVCHLPGHEAYGMTGTVVVRP
ncbi:MAG TPA: plastocyanin/azurin family copper-binding protein [Vitreimonas sp.]|nr:plastocyanin/azurin family copper-binding protein [Vitreimonas sp.]